MKTILVQNKQDVSSMVDRLLKMSGTNLSKVCAENGLRYSTVIQRLKAKQVDPKFLSNLIELINENARLDHEFSVSLIVDNEIVITQKSK